MYIHEQINTNKSHAYCTKYIKSHRTIHIVYLITTYIKITPINSLMIVIWVVVRFAIFILSHQMRMSRKDDIVEKWMFLSSGLGFYLFISLLCRPVNGLFILGLKVFCKFFFFLWVITKYEFPWRLNLVKFKILSSRGI